MKNKDEIDEVDEMLPEYDFSKGVRGKYAEKYAQGTNLVLLNPDIAEVFSDSRLVNSTLRAVAKVVKSTVKTRLL